MIQFARLFTLSLQKIKTYTVGRERESLTETLTAKKIKKQSKSSRQLGTEAQNRK